MKNTKKAIQGLIVMTLGVVASNGIDQHPAIITRVWGDKPPTDEAPGMVNVTVFPDSPRDGAAATVSQGSIDLYATRAGAEAAQAKVNAVGENGANFQKRGLSGPMVAFWPDCV